MTIRKPAEINSSSSKSTGFYNNKLFCPSFKDSLYFMALDYPLPDSTFTVEPKVLRADSIRIYKSGLPSSLLPF